MNRKDKTKALQKIRSAWSRVQYIANNTRMTQYGTRLLKQNKQEAKEHDKFRGSLHRDISIIDEAKFFATKRVLEYTYGLNQFKPDAKDFMSLLTSVYMAYAIAHECHDRIKDNVSKEEAEYIHNLDYVELINECD